MVEKLELSNKCRVSDLQGKGSGDLSHNNVNILNCIFKMIDMVNLMCFQHKKREMIYSRVLKQLFFKDKIYE